MGRKYVWTGIWVLYVGFIFHNSMTPAVESSAQSGFVLECVQKLLWSLGADDLSVTEHLIRKTAHVLEYALMGMLLFQMVRQYGAVGRGRWLVHGLLGFLVPFADETIQLFTTGRSGQISDVWLDCGGVLIGTLLFMGILWLGKARKRKRIEKKLQNGTAV